jgi:acyl-CoA thioester hydrolase
MLTQHEIEIRVRYPETDPGGYAHHSSYLTWFEMGRTELLRANGRSYRDMEAAGLFVVVARIECRYVRPARYDDLLRLRTTVTRVTLARIEHDYHLYRDNELLTEAHIVLCCVDRDATPQRLPEWMAADEGQMQSAKGKVQKDK